MSQYEAVICGCSYTDLIGKISGAIMIDEDDFKITIIDSNFYSCSSYETTNSSARNGVASGSIYLTVKTVEINKIYSYQCKTVGGGHAIYIYCPDYQNARVVCFSDFNSGQQTNSGTESAVILSDKGFSDYSSLNFSYPIHISRAGAITLGMYPLSAHLSYTNIVFNDNSAVHAVALTSDENCLTKCSHLNVVNFKNPSNDAIFSLWKGAYELSFISLIDCTGPLTKVYNAIQKITFSDSYFSNGIDVDSTIEVNNAVDEDPEEILVYFYCPNQSECSCEHGNRVNQSFALAFVALMCWNS